MRKKLYIYGDSVMTGAVIENDCADGLAYKSMIDPIIQSFMQSFPIDITNRSRYGITIDLGQRMLKRDLDKNIYGDYALIEFGGNDCNFHWDQIAQNPESDHQPKTNINSFIEILTQMIRALKQKNTKPILMTLPPIDAEKYLSFLDAQGCDKTSILKWLGDAQMIYRFHEYYSNIIAKTALSENILLINMRQYFLNRRDFHTLMCKDGLHLNQKGHEIMFRAFSDFASQHLFPSESHLAYQSIL